MSQQIISLIATTSERLSDLAIKNAQLIFVKDKHKIALDLNEKRTFYNDITLIETESDRKELSSPINDCFYFVVGTGAFWFYKNGWVQLTTPPEQILFIGTDFPELGNENKLYINKEKQNISIWDTEKKKYILVGEVINSVPNSEIDKLFN